MAQIAVADAGEEGAVFLLEAVLIFVAAAVL